MEAHIARHQTELCRSYFRAFLPSMVGELLLPGLHALHCRLGVSITDRGGESWTLVIQAGRLDSVKSGRDDVDCTFHLDTWTLLEVATGTLAPDRAFFDLRIEIAGDMALGLQLSTVLAPFFQQYPYRLAP